MVKRTWSLIVSIIEAHKKLAFLMVVFMPHTLQCTLPFVITTTYLAHDILHNFCKGRVARLNIDNILTTWKQKKVINKPMVKEIYI